MARGNSRASSEVLANSDKVALKLSRTRRGTGPVAKINGEPAEVFFNRALNEPIQMTAADRFPEGSVREWKHTDRVFSTAGKLTVLSDMPGFVNDPNDPESLHATLAWRNNSFETMAFFTDTGKRIGTWGGNENSVETPGEAVLELSRSNGISVHNHPNADITFSGPDIRNWVEANNQEMIVISPKFAYSIRHTDKSRRVPPGRPDFTDHGDRVADYFERMLYNPAALAETKLLVGRHGWNAKNKQTGEVEKRYGDTHQPPNNLVCIAHMERCMKQVAKKFGFEYVKYPLPA
jgi:hypothetical protein